MKKATIIGIDLAKNVFHLHGAAADGSVLFRKKLTRPQLLQFMAEQPRCIVAMEACGGSHFWAREMTRIGHEARLIAPIYVKPFVKRQKNDAADAEAIVEAALRPTMRFVTVKSEDQQARAVLFRAREQVVNQRTEMVNALRAHLGEFGHIAPQGINNLRRLEEIIEDADTSLPDLARDICRDMLTQISQFSARLAAMAKQIDALSKHGAITRRLRTMPGVGPICAMAVETFAPHMESFRRGRDFAAWLGLVPRQNSTGGKQRLGRTSKMGQRDIRRLLIIGAMAIVRWALRKGAVAGSWLARMLAEKRRAVVAIALANKMARGIWAMMTKQEEYRGPAMIAA
ncbi:IS110 family transposase [Paracoccus sp. 11-3]|uniref:IS110 family transposase n=1 Tax=Paracoccus amoyensis TaxID=2760093 RepID=A0A926GRQ8_9RHOB|nr:IS110 family transposase [Paracoccus amoyensis]MBC9248645.1 IS110 family transposase [Paracoccus amoyensis]